MLIFKQKGWAIFHTLSCEEIKLQFDKYSKYKSLAVYEFLNSNNIKWIDWQAYSPDLNPIENMWGIIKWNLARIEIKTILELKKTIRKLWDRIPDNVVKRSIMSMTWRIQDWEKGRGANVNVYRKTLCPSPPFV